MKASGVDWLIDVCYSIAGWGILKSGPIHGPVIGVYSFEMWGKDRGVLCVGGGKIFIGETEVHHDWLDVMALFATDEELDSFPRLF